MPIKLFSFSGDGWYPRVDATGETVCFGNLESRAWHIGGGIWPPEPGRQSCFIRPGVVTFTRELSQTAKERYERDLVTGAVTLTTDRPGLVAGNSFDADNGHWASNIAAGRLVIDGIPYEARYRGVAVRWPYVLTTQDDRDLVLFREGEPFSRFGIPPRGNDFKLGDDLYVSTGYWWDARMVGMSTRRLYDISLPWRVENPPCLVRADATLWAWSFTETADKRYAVIGRTVDTAKTIPTPVMGIILRDFPATSLDVRFDATRRRFLIAGSDDHGTLQIWASPLGEPLESLADWYGKVPTVPVPVPIPTPDPPKPDPPKEPTAMQLPSEVRAVIGAYAEKFPLPSGAPGAAKDEAAREWTTRLCSQLAWRFGPRWGSKRAGGPPSKDSIAYNGPDKLWGFDLLNGVGTFNTTLQIPNDGLNLTDPPDGPQTFVECGTHDVPAPQNWLTETPQEPDQPDQPDQPGEQPDNHLIDALIAELKANTAALERNTVAVHGAAMSVPAAVLEAVAALNERIDRIERDGVKVRFR